MSSNNSHKRVRLSSSSSKQKSQHKQNFSSNFLNLKSAVIFNIDIFNLIILNLRPLEMLNTLFLVNNILYNFISTNNKSFHTITLCINYDYGKIKNNKNFEKILKNKKFNNSYKIIYFYYQNLFAQFKQQIPTPKRVYTAMYEYAFPKHPVAFLTELLKVEDVSAITIFYWIKKLIRGHNEWDVMFETNGSITTSYRHFNVFWELFATSFEANEQFTKEFFQLLLKYYDQIKPNKKSIVK